MTKNDELQEIFDRDPELFEWTRRTFLKKTGLAVAGVALADLWAVACGGTPTNTATTGKPPVPRAGARIVYTQWNSFVKAGDTEVIRQAKEFSDKFSCEVVVQTITQDDLIAKTAAYVQAGDGPDVISMQYSWPFLYTSACLDVTNEVNILKQKLGTVHPVNDAYCKVNGVYRAVPYTIVMNAWSYRTDYFTKAGVSGFPQTFEDMITAAGKLKSATGKPIAQTVGHAYGDSLTMWLPVLWAHGAAENDKNGKVTINSAATMKAIDWAKRAQAAGAVFHPEWLDPDNNQAYHSDNISATLNGPSIYVKERDTNKKFDKVTDNAVMPAGPNGLFTMNLIFNQAVMKWTKEAETAKAFVLWQMDKDNYLKWMGPAAAAGYDIGPFKEISDAPIFHSDPKLKAFHDVAYDVNGKPVGYWPGWPAPPSKKSSQAQAQYISADMFAKVLAGTDAKAAVQEAEDRLKNIWDKP
jgi:multiple sugar transport system substrate-binding protein